MNPLDLPGPKFLLFYIIALMIAILIATLFRRWLIGSGEDFAGRAVTVDPYEAAYLRGGAKQVIEVALAMLAQSKSLKASKHDRTISIYGPLPFGAHRFEKAVYTEAGPGPGRKINNVCSSALLTSYTELIARNLKTSGLVLSNERWKIRRLLSTLVMVAVLLLGVAKILIGISRDRPVGLLTILCIITAIIAYVFFKAPPPVTRLGKQVLKQLKQENAALEATARSNPRRLASADIALALGIFGIEALAFTDDSWTDFRAALSPPSSSSSGGSSCSSSSCGSSCGGGCGGGCGGCGS